MTIQKRIDALRSGGTAQTGSTQVAPPAAAQEEKPSIEERLATLRGSAPAPAADPMVAAIVASQTTAPGTGVVAARQAERRAAMERASREEIGAKAGTREGAEAALNRAKGALSFAQDNGEDTRPYEQRVAQAQAAYDAYTGDDPSLLERIARTVTGGVKGAGAQYANAAGTLAAAAAPGAERQRKAEAETARALGGGFWGNLFTMMAQPRSGNPGADMLARGARQLTPEIARRVEETADTLAQSSAGDVERAKQGAGYWGRLGVDAGVGVTQMGLDAAVGLATGGGAMAPMMVRSFGGGAQEARQKGYSTERQVALGLSNAVTEYVSEKLFGGNPIYDKDAGWVNKLIGRLTKNDTLLRVLGSAPIEKLNEGLEEIVSDLINPLAEWAITGNRPEYEADQIIEDGMVGVLTALLADGGAQVVNAGKRAAGSLGNRAGGVTATETVQNAPPAAAGGRSTAEGVSQPIQSREAVRGPQGEAPVQALFEQKETAPTREAAAPGVKGQSAQAGGELSADPLLQAMLGGKRVSPAALTDAQAGALVAQGAVAVDSDGQAFVPNPAQHIDRRTRESVGDRKVNAFQFDHPALHEYFVEAARWLTEDLDSTTRGERRKTYDADGYQNGMGGVKRYTSEPIAALLDQYGLSYADIRKALDAIIHNHGQENYAAAKRVELVLDDALTQGYTNLAGEYLPPNEEYLRIKSGIPGGEYTETIGAQQTPEGPAGVGAAAHGFITGEETKTDTSRLADGVLHPNPSRRAAAGGMTRAEWNDLFRYRVQSEEQSMQYATEQLYADIGGKQTFIRDFDRDGYDALTRELTDAPAWNGVMTDMAVLIANELERRSNFVDLGDPGQAVSNETYLDWVNTMREKATETGRGTQAWAKWTRYNQSMTPELRLESIERSLSRYARETGMDLEIPEEIRQAYLDAETEAERDAAVDRMVKAIARQLPTSALERWNSLRYLNMLGNFKTQIRNLTGNTVMREMVRAKDAVATLLEGITHAVSGGKFERTKALLPGKDLVAAAKADFAIVERAALGDGKYSVREGQRAGNEILDRAQEEKRIFRLAPLEGYRRATSWAMEKGDVIFSRSTYAGALAGWLKAHGITAEQFQSAEWQSDNAETLEKARQYAIREAQEATFRDTNAVSAWVSKIARGSKTPKAVRVAMEGILPFRKTPANVAVRAVEYSPAGFLTTAYQAAQAARGKGNVTGADIVNQFSKNLTGTGLFALGMALRSMGALRGGPDDDDRQEAFDKLTGHQDYSLELPDGTSYTLDWLTPAAMPLFMGVGFYDAIRENGMEAGDILPALESAGEALLDPMLEMSMLSGISDTLDSIAYSENRLGRLAVQAGIGYLTQGLSNTLLGQLERSGEENRMTTYTTKDSPLPPWLQYEIGRLSAKTPGWDYQQREYTDAWGRTQSSGGPVERALINLFSPGYVSHIREDDTERELRRVAEATGDTTVYPGTAAKKYTIGGKDIYMTMEDYSEYAKALGEYRQKYYADLLLAPLYAAMSDEDKAEAIGKMESYAGYRGKKDADPDYGGTAEMQGYARADGAGIDPVQYMMYQNATKGLTADKDENGKTISGSKKAKVVEVLDRMEISREAKDYLYLQVEGYGEKELSNMPWNR